MINMVLTCSFFPDAWKMYADNVQLYLSDDLFDGSIYRMNVDLDRLYIWATENGLHLNPEESPDRPL
jgi:hypothetical protein